MRHAQVIRRDFLDAAASSEAFEQELEAEEKAFLAEARWQAEEALLS